MLKKSKDKANGCPWKLPAEIIKSSSGKMVGLSVTALISLATTSVT